MSEGPSPDPFMHPEGTPPAAGAPLESAHSDQSPDAQAVLEAARMIVDNAAASEVPHDRPLPTSSSFTPEEAVLAAAGSAVEEGREAAHEGAVQDMEALNPPAHYKGRYIDGWYTRTPGYKGGNTEDAVARALNILKDPAFREYYGISEEDLPDAIKPPNPTDQEPPADNGKIG